MEAGPLKDDGSLTLEVYPSLRSPYTSIVFDRALQLARDTGVKLVVRPVLPMVMRGVPATPEKGMYIFSDVQREAQEAGVPFGNIYDPIGEPCASLLLNLSLGLPDRAEVMNCSPVSSVLPLPRG